MTVNQDNMMRMLLQKIGCPLESKMNHQIAFLHCANLSLIKPATNLCWKKIGPKSFIEKQQLYKIVGEANFTQISAEVEGCSDESFLSRYSISNERKLQKEELKHLQLSSCQSISETGAVIRFNSIPITSIPITNATVWC